MLRHSHVRVLLTGRIVGGDSGAWVIANDTGLVCGHVLAENHGLTYICPMELLLEDIRRSLGAAKVSLPGDISDSEQKAGEETVRIDSPEQQTLAGMVGTLNLDDGGVALPSRVRVLPQKSGFTKVLAPAQLA